MLWAGSEPIPTRTPRTAPSRLHAPPTACRSRKRSSDQGEGWACLRGVPWLLAGFAQAPWNKSGEWLSYSFASAPRRACAGFGRVRTWCVGSVRFAERCAPPKSAASQTAQGLRRSRPALSLSRRISELAIEIRSSLCKIAPIHGIPLWSLFGVVPLSRQVLHAQMKEHARCLSLPQLTQSILNLGAGPLPAIEMILRSLLLDIYTERRGTEAANDLLGQLGLAGIEQPGILLA